MSGHPDKVLQQVAKAFDLRRAVTVRKDAEVVRAMMALQAAKLPDGIRLVFAGGTCMARAWRILERMSEDVDFKVVLPEGLSNSQKRKLLGANKDAIREALTGAGFKFARIVRTDGTGNVIKEIDGIESLRENGLVKFYLDYGDYDGGVMRSHIQIEVYESRPRLPTSKLPMSSMVHQALKLDAELAGIECTSVTETAAEKLVALTRRTAGLLETGSLEDMDRFQVRNLYDLHCIAASPRFDRAAAMVLAKTIAFEDAIKHQNAKPGYYHDPKGWTERAMDHLESNPQPKNDYMRFVDEMVYGRKPSFADTIMTLRGMVDDMWATMDFRDHARHVVGAIQAFNKESTATALPGGALRQVSNTPTSHTASNGTVSVEFAEEREHFAVRVLQGGEVVADTHCADGREAASYLTAHLNMLAAKAEYKNGDQPEP